jgi:hypothetical protein
MRRPRRITPQFSGGALPCEARRTCIMKWRTCDAPATPYHRPLQLLVRRHSTIFQYESFRTTFPSRNS